MRSSREAIEARRNDILFKLTSNPGVIFSCRELKDEFNLSDNTFYHDMEVLKKANTYIVMNAGKVFYDIPKKVRPIIHEVKKPERYSGMKGNNGLQDPTAQIAIKNAEPAAKEMIFPRPGDVWLTTKSVGKPDTEHYTVLAVNKDKQTATCIKYSADGNADTCDISLYTKPLKYFVGNERVWGMPGSYVNRVLERIGEFLDIPVREVEKTVEVVKEVPVEVVKEVPATVDTTGMLTQDEVDLLLAQQRAEIYEECFKLVTKR